MRERGTSGMLWRNYRRQHIKFSTASFRMFYFSCILSFGFSRVLVFAHRMDSIILRAHVHLFA